MSKKSYTFSARDLNEIRMLARSFYMDEANNGRLNADEFNAQCFTKAVLHFLTSKGESLSTDYHFPSRKSTESIEDE